MLSYDAELKNCVNLDKSSTIALLLLDFCLKLAITSYLLSFDRDIVVCVVWEVWSLAMVSVVFDILLLILVECFHLQHRKRR